MSKNKFDSELKWRVYHFILNNGEVSVEQLAEEFNFPINTNPKTHDKCIAIRNLIDEINLSVDPKAIIIRSRDYKYWIATSEEEAKAFIEKNYMLPALKRLSKYWKLLKTSTDFEAFKVHGFHWDYLTEEWVKD